MNALPRRRLLVALAALAACRGGGPHAAAAAATSAAATVTLTPRALTVTGVETEKATATSVPMSFATTGQIQFDPSRVTVVNAPVTGRVRRVLTNVGDRVAVGDTLVTLESPEFLSGVTTVTAPRSGVVQTLQAAPQQLETAGAELLRIAGIDRVWLQVDLYGEYAQHAEPGTPIEARVAAFPDAVWRGEIAAVAPSVEGATQTVEARVVLENPDRRLLPGMFADVQVTAGGNTQGILVPRAAVIYDGARQLVMIKQGTNYFPSVVTLGPTVGDRVTVLRGVNVGEDVVVHGGYELLNAGYALARGSEEE